MPIYYSSIEKGVVGVQHPTEIYYIHSHPSWSSNQGIYKMCEVRLKAKQEKMQKESRESLGDLSVV